MVRYVIFFNSLHVSTELRLTYCISILSPPIVSSLDAFNFLSEIWNTEVIELQEQFYILLLNNNNEVISWRCVNTGTSNKCDIDIKMVIACSVIAMASNVIIAHNHPSGNMTPSRADVLLTNKLFRALDLLDIKLMDHVIISRNGYYSFIDNKHVME